MSNIYHAHKGRWYYELTHYSGPNQHVSGFLLNHINYARALFYPRSILPDASIFLENCSSTVDSYTPLGFKYLTNTSTIGISYDAFNDRIDFRVENESKGYYIKTDSPPNIYRVYVSHADRNEPDVVSVNFGEKAFYYGLPPGYTTLDGKIRSCTNIEIQPYFIYNNIFYIILHLLS